MKDLIKTLKNMKLTSGIYHVSIEHDKCQVMISRELFNSMYSIRSVIKFGDRHDKHFVDDGPVHIYCLVRRDDPEPEVRTYDPTQN